MTNAPIRIVVFDLGGVMIRITAGWQGACEEAGVRYCAFNRTPAFVERWNALDYGIGTGQLDPEQLFTELHDLLDGQYSVDDLRLIYQTIIREEFPGIAETVQALKAAGYRTACLSNTSAPHWVDLINPAIYPGIAQLDYQHASHLFGLMKPDERIYRRFEQEVACAPQEILFFDDLPANIDAARACGWHAIRITPDRPSVAQIHEALARHGVRIEHEVH